MNFYGGQKKIGNHPHQKTIRKYKPSNLGIQKESDINVSVGLIDGDMFRWRLCFEGPTGTPFQEGLYQAILEFPNDYPYMPPKMTFQT